MPQKRNPISCEVILAQSKILRAQADLVLDGMLSDFERASGPWHLEWAAIPTAYEARIGSQITNNLAFQYRLRRIFWPQLEVNWTYFPDGQRGGKNQVLLTPGLVVGRLPLTDQLRLTVGVGYQSAITPNYHASPLVPAYNHAWILSSRLGF